MTINIIYSLLQKYKTLSKVYNFSEYITISWSELLDDTCTIDPYKQKCLQSDNCSEIMFIVIK